MFIAKGDHDALNFILVAILDSMEIYCLWKILEDDINQNYNRVPVIRLIGLVPRGLLFGRFLAYSLRV